MIRYNDESFPSFEELDGDFSREEYITIVKLNGLSKIANVLDKSNRQKIKNVGVSERKWNTDNHGGHHGGYHLGKRTLLT